MKDKIPPKSINIAQDHKPSCDTNPINKHTPKQALHEIAQQVKLDLVGVCGPEVFVEVEAILAKQAAQGYVTPFTTANRAERVDPSKVLPVVKSIIAVGISYHQATENPQLEPHEVVRGSFASFARGRDYHQVLKDKINLLMLKWQQVLGQQITWQAQVDTGSLPDRAVAWRAGFGWYGHNCNIINPQFGSWLVLGTILVDLLLEPDQVMQRDCGACRLCIQACPTGALEAPYQLNAYRCISYLTQAPGYIPRDLRKAMGSQIYGCDICQQVCPQNKLAKPGNHPEFQHEAVGPTMASGLILDKFLKITNREFAHGYAQTTAGWRGKKLLQRNAIIALGNTGNVATIPILKEALQDPRPELRGHAAWSLGQIGGQQVKAMLAEALAGECNAEVRSEIAQTLKEIDI